MSFSISIDDFKSKGRLCCLSTIFAALQFLLLTTVAALFYPGGYDYFGYNFSDLGRVVAINTVSNPFSSLLFLITLTLVAIFMIPTWLILPSLFKESTAEKSLSYLGSCFGFIASPFAFLTGFFPVDTEPDLHGDVARFFFLTFGLAILIYSIAILFNQNYSNYFSIIGLAIFIIVVAYVFSVFGVWSPFVQKVIIYSYILWAFIQVFRIWPSVKPQIN